MKFSKSYYLLIILISLISCNEAVSPDPVNLGLDYFPLRTGDVRIYNVVRIDYNIDLTKDSVQYQLMEVVADSFQSAGETSFRLERFTRLDETMEWQIDSVWTARINNYQAVVVENNVPIIKLSFPLEEDRRWDGNAMNSRVYDEFKMVKVGLPHFLDVRAFQETVELVKEDALDPTKTTTDDYRIEVFARGVGMIHRIDIFRDYCGVQNCPNDSSIITSGLELEYKLIDYQRVE